MNINYPFLIQREVRKKQEKYDINNLFERPLIHRQIAGEEVYVPLDKKRLWGD